MNTLSIILTITFGLVSGTLFAGVGEEATMNRFLRSESTREQQKAFSEIVAHSADYKELVFDELQKHAATPDRVPDGLVYLAAFVRDQTYLQPLANLINNADYSENRCIYRCPIVFSLVVYSSFAEFRIPVLDGELTAVSDMKTETAYVKGLALRAQRVGDFVEGPGVDRLVRELEALPLSEVVKIAGPETTDPHRRGMAACVLQAHIVDDKYLSELYWLAIADLPGDASGEFRGSIHLAIYKAEKFRMLKKK